MNQLHPHPHRVTIGRVLNVILVISCWTISTVCVYAGNVENAADWSIENSTAPELVKLKFMVTEGTRISVDVSPNGEHVAFDLLGHIYQVPIGGGRATALTSGRSWNITPRYSPNGQEIAFVSDRGGSEDIWVLNLETGELSNVTNMVVPVYAPRWARNGGAIYATSTEQHIDYGYTFHGRRFDLAGGAKRLVGPEGTHQPLGRFQELPGKNLVLFEHMVNQGLLYGGGATIKSYNPKTGDVTDYITRPGGAYNPLVSPNGKHLVYGHRVDAHTQLILLNLGTGEQRVLETGLDLDHQDRRAFPYGRIPDISWSPDSRKVYFSKRGGIHWKAIDDNTSGSVPFKALVNRKLDKTFRFHIPLEKTNQKTRIHRWAHRTERGVVYESLGDIYLKHQGRVTNVSNSSGNASSPVYSTEKKQFYYVEWTDDSLAKIKIKKIGAGVVKNLTEKSNQYGGLSLSEDEKLLAYFRGNAALSRQSTIQKQHQFELVYRDLENPEVVHKVTDVSGAKTSAFKLPLSVRFGPNNQYLYYTWFKQEQLVLSRIHRTGGHQEDLVVFPNAISAVISPDFRWIAYLEYHRAYLTPLDYIGTPTVVSEFDDKGVSIRIDKDDGLYLNWSDADTVSWVRGSTFYEKGISEILRNGPGLAKTESIALDYKVDLPKTRLALTGATVITMNSENKVMEDATVLITGNRITAVGQNIEVPTDYHVMEMDSRVLIPGLVDAHAHYDANISQFNIIEQNLAGLSSTLAYGVTTLYEVYGTVVKDIWLMDMLQSGNMTGSRLFTVGDPALGLRYPNKKDFRPIASLDDARELVRWNRDHGATAIKDYANYTRRARYQLMTAAREQKMNVISESSGNIWLNFTQILDGVSGIEHSFGISPLYRDSIEFVSASDTGITPTLLLAYNGPWGLYYFNQTEKVWENEKLRSFNSYESLLFGRRSRHFWPDDMYARTLAQEHKKLFDAGTLINVGAHGLVPGLDAHWEMELLVQGGFSPLEAIQAGTISGAKYHGLDADLGTIEAGKLADLIVLGSDPRSDIRNTRDIRFVIKNGRVYNDENLNQVYPVEKPGPRPYLHVR